MTVPAAVDQPGRAAVEHEVGAAPELRGARWWTTAVVAAWAATVALAAVVGWGHRDTWKLGAVPLAGRMQVHVTPATLAVAVLGVALARSLPSWATRTSWRRLVVGTAALALVWGAALAVTRGASGLDRGPANRHDYVAVVDKAEHLGVDRFVHTFTKEWRLKDYPIHVQGHPVGTPLVFVGLDRVGLGGARWAAAFVLALSSTAFAAVLWTVREVAGEDRARRLAPFLVLAPALVWWVTSVDALFAAVGAWTVAAMVAACSPGRPPAARVALALLAGLAWGVGVHLTYGLVPIVAVGAAVVVARRRWEVPLLVGVGAMAVALAFGAVGFWWPDGLAATKVRYVAGVASARPYGYFTVLGNPAALALAVGPAAWVALARVRDRGLLLLGLAAAAAVAVADLSGLSKSEVERIWLPFSLWLLVPTAGLAAGRRGPRLAGSLLLDQALLAVAVESIVRTPW